MQESAQCEKKMQSGPGDVTAHLNSDVLTNMVQMQIIRSGFKSPS